MKITAVAAIAAAVPASAATIADFTQSGNDLATVTLNQDSAGTVVYNAADLVNGTVTSYADDTSPGVLTNSTTTPAPGTRAAPLSDLAINTGFLNVQNDGHLTFTFDSPIANTTGIDLLIFDWGAFGGNTPDQFAITINGVTQTGLTSSDSSVPAGGDWYQEDRGTPVTGYTHIYPESGGVDTLAEFESIPSGDFNAAGTSGSQYVGLIGLDLDAFDVAPGGAVTSLTISGGNSQVDPTLILGIEVVPEPGSLGVLAIGGLAVLRRRRA